jgi:hypothetical protein
MNRKVVRFKLSSGGSARPLPAESLRDMDQWVSGSSEAHEANPPDRTTYAAVLEIFPGSAGPAGHAARSEGGPRADGPDSLPSSFDEDDARPRGFLEANVAYLRRCVRSFGQLYEVRTPWDFALLHARVLQDGIAHMLTASSEAASAWARTTETAARHVRQLSLMPVEGRPALPRNTATQG